jgi:hypothetical protein
MIDARCTPLGTVELIAERERRPDRFAELLECIADLLVEVRVQRMEMTQNPGPDDPRGQEAIARLAELERSIEEVGIEAASVHQQLQHVRMI